MTEVAAASIVVPLLSQQDDWLEQCLRSALTQTVAIPVLVVTSGKTPNSNLELLRWLSASYPQLEWFERQPKSGFAGAINEGFTRSRSPRVGLLLSDDWLSPDTIERCLLDQADIVSTGHIGYSADGGTILWRRRLSQEAFDALPTLERKASYLAHFFLFRREAVLDVGGVDPGIGQVGPDDYDLPWTLLEQGASVALTDAPMYHCRDHALDRLTLRPQAEQLRDLRKILHKHGVDEHTCERLMAEKARWYGVPCHVAMENPDWYRDSGTRPD